MDVRDDVGPRRWRVLIIDDDALILAALERQLGAGHDVVAVEDPCAALVQIRGGASFDVILCDLRMPSMSGLQFHAELVREAPRLAERIVLMTGGGGRREALELVAAAQIPTLAKPFDPETLRRLIESVTAA